MNMLSREDYTIQQFNNPYISNTVLDLVRNLQDNERVIFTKFGDGEGSCMMNVTGRNCDGDTYTSQLGQKLREAFVKLCQLYDNVYIGRWHSNQQHYINFYINLCYDYFYETKQPLKSIPFVDYHYCYPDNNFNKTNDMYEFVKTLQNIKKYKIVVSNSNNKNLSIIFKSNEFIEIPTNSWFANGLYQDLYTKIDMILQQYPDAILLIAGGLASKVLICELAFKYKNASFIDIGSGFDILSQNRYTRTWNETPDFNNSFENQKKYFADLLPCDYVV